MTKSIVFLLLTLITFQLKSQTEYYDPSVELEEQLPIPRLAIKLVPSQLLWRYPAYTLAIEHSLKRNVNVEYKFGLIQNRDVFDDDEIYFANKSGFKSSVLLRSYRSNLLLDLVGLDIFKSPIIPFWGVEAFYNNLSFDRTRVFRMSCGNNCEFFQNATYGINIQELGTRANIGFLMPLLGPLNFELAIAFGFSYQRYLPDGRKPSEFIDVFGKNYREDFSGLIPELNIAAKLVFVIK